MEGVGRSDGGLKAKDTEARRGRGSRRTCLWGTPAADLRGRQNRGKTHGRPKTIGCEVGKLRLREKRRCQLPESPPVATETWYQRLLREVRCQTLRPRRDRWYARVIKRKMSNWMKKRPEHRNPPQPTKPFHEAVVLVI